MSSFDPERHCQCESKACPLQHPLRPRVAPVTSTSHTWTVFAANGEAYAWCTTFEDAVRFATEAGHGARIEGPWKELLTLRPEVALTEAARIVQDALLAAVGRADMPAVTALTHALTALTHSTRQSP